jgi:hypothetical protein
MSWEVAGAEAWVAAEGLAWAFGLLPAFPPERATAVASGMGVAAAGAGVPGSVARGWLGADWGAIGCEVATGVVRAGPPGPGVGLPGAAAAWAAAGGSAAAAGVAVLAEGGAVASGALAAPASAAGVGRLAPGVVAVGWAPLLVAVAGCICLDGGATAACAWAEG